MNHDDDHAPELAEPHPAPLPRDPPAPPGWEDPVAESEALDDLTSPSVSDPPD